MDVKRYFRGPVIWVVLAVVAVLAVMQLVSSAGGPKSVDTSVVLDAIQNNQVVSAKVVGGSGSSVEVKLADGPIKQAQGNADSLKATYLNDQQGFAITQALDTARQAGHLPKGYNISLAKQNAFVGILITLLPFVL